MPSEGENSHDSGRGGGGAAPGRHSPSPVVVDASALGALLFGEPEASAVADQLEGRALFAPTIVRYELAAIALKKIERQPLSRGSIEAALALFERLDVREVQVPPAELVKGARAREVTAREYAYEWLARTLNAELVRLGADGRLGRGDDDPAGESIAGDDPSAEGSD